MERKTTQRIIGILVVAALVVILLPLLFNGNTSQVAQTAEVKAPPFPDQASTNQVALNPNPTATASDTVNTTDSLAQANTSTPLPATNNDVPSVQAPAATTEVPATSALSTNQVTVPEVNANTPAVSNNSLDTPVPVETVKTSEANTNAAAPTIESLNVPPMATNESAPAPASVVTTKTDIAPQKTSDLIPVKVKTNKLKHLAHKQNLNNLKNPAWVVQMGSFKNKINAIRLTNRLRAQGYKAFTREVKSTLRVYVGPEFKQASAASVASKIEQQLNIHGIVVSYQPLEL